VLKELVHSRQWLNTLISRSLVRLRLTAFVELLPCCNIIITTDIVLEVGSTSGSER